jgi:hypothetical protein
VLPYRGRRGHFFLSLYSHPTILRLTLKKQRPIKKKPRRSAEEDGERFGKLGATTSQIVLDAAALLDEEMAAGILAAKRVQERFQKERRIESADFGEALQRFQSDAHDIVNTLKDQFTRLRSPENDQLIDRLLKNTHDLLDLAVGMVNTGAEIASQLAQSNLNRPNERSAKARRPR